MIYLIIFLFQYLFNLLKVMEIKYSYEEKIKPLIIVTALLSAIVLASTYFSFTLLLKGDLKVIPIYIIGSILGKLTAIKINNTRAKIFHKLFNKDKDKDKDNNNE